uniref:Neural proliferation differentiation and control protein 1 n=1 Tax=Geotrypetes seraphini TaxID=260995 RepID=A0A6P8SC37_GEOSA|nr:neural proliferation differentiation and control protein 1 [Geotrypetes seraphini]
MVVEREAAACRLRAFLLCRLALAAWLLNGAVASPSADSCPRNLDCTLKKREFCSPGSESCGPCLKYFMEDIHGNCIPERNNHAKKSSLTSDDDKIDYLAFLLDKQATQLSNDAPLVESSGKNQAVKPNATDQPIASTKGSPRDSHAPFSDAILLGLVIACTTAGLTALIVAALCWCRLKKEIRLAQKTDYTAQKAPGPPPYDKTSPDDKKLAQSAQMYHYQHQKQQMLSMEKHKEEPKLPDSATTSDEENEDGDFTVYECPGLAPTGEMEVKNPLFDDSSLHPSPKSQ